MRDDEDLQPVSKPVLQTVCHSACLTQNQTHPVPFGRYMQKRHWDSFVLFKASVRVRPSFFCALFWILLIIWGFKRHANPLIKSNSLPQKLCCTHPQNHTVKVARQVGNGTATIISSLSFTLCQKNNNNNKHFSPPVRLIYLHFLRDL